jgi:hypothetical protein
MFIKIINNRIVPIEDPTTIGTDPTIVEVTQHIPPYIKGRQVINFIGVDITVSPPIANYNILDLPVNDRKLYLINLVEYQKSKNRITLETAFQRIDAITNCITHDDIDAYEQSIQQS